MFDLFTTTQPNTAKLASQLDAALRKQASAQAEVDRALATLAKATEAVDQLRAALNQHINPPSSRYQDPGTPNRTNTPSITQSNPSPTQAAGVLHKQTMQTTRPAQANPHQHAINSKPAPVRLSEPAAESVAPHGLSTKHAPEVPANKVTTIKGMEGILNNRVQYHTDAVCIISVKDEGLLKLYPHYVSGDGINSGVPTPEGYQVELKVSKTGKQYRLVHVPALQITCALSRPLPTDFMQCKEVLREWLKANEYLRGLDTKKLQFTTEYDFYNQEYSPYVSVDGKGTTLYIYIGTESLNSTTPAPTLIA